MQFRFAAATEAHFETLLAIRMRAMRPSLERAGRYDPDRARQRFRAAFSPATTRRILLEDDSLAGCVALSPQGDHLELDQFYLEPATQGRGLGSAVLRALLAEADAMGLPVRCTVLRGSDANRLYPRFGFRFTGEAEHDLFYERPAGG